MKRLLALVAFVPLWAIATLVAWLGAVIVGAATRMMPLVLWLANVADGDE